MTGREMTGLVLAGGRSTRMGTDKALLEIDGVRLVDRAVAILAEVCISVVVATGQRRIAALQVEQIADGGVGPLGGIVAGLRCTGTPLLAVVAVDMPWASAGVLRDLAARWDGHPAVAPRVAGVIQPLHAVYATAWTATFADLLEDGQRSPSRALEDIGALLVDDITAEAQVWRSVNAPEDLAALQVGEARRP